MKRDAFFDNAKVILIFLVVFGHMIQPITNDSSGVNTLYLWIYTFHMPAFIFVAGFFAKGSGNIKYILKLAQKLLIPYIIFQTLYSLFYFFAGEDGWNVGLFYPHWSLWFLFSLFSWHLLLCLFKKMPPGLSIISALLLGTVVGYFDNVGHLFSLSRTIVFFPFFLTGYWLTKEHIMWVKRRSAKIIASMILIFVAAAIYFAPEFSSGWLLASKSYGDLGVPYYGGLARLSVYGTSAIMVLCVLAFIPQRNLAFTSLGTRTLYVYLLHGFFIQLFRKYDIFMQDNLLSLSGLAIISAIIVVLLSSKFVMRLSQPIVEASFINLQSLYSNKRAQDRAV